ncbi:MAG: hypothetical protein ACD_60C00025G0055 [uncultured bacterium]|nr:MAG: hypothetical protein ACD_60C00025G0055 [uncultured bacterium]
MLPLELISKCHQIIQENKVLTIVPDVLKKRLELLTAVKTSATPHKVYGDFSIYLLSLVGQLEKAKDLIQALNDAEGVQVVGNKQVTAVEANQIKTERLTLIGDIIKKLEGFAVQARAKSQNEEKESVVVPDVKSPRAAVSQFQSPKAVVQQQGQPTVATNRFTFQN